MKSEIINSAAALSSITPQWSELLARSEANEPTVSPLWLTNWWRIFGNTQGRKLQTVVFRDNGQLVGLAPLLSRTVWTPAKIPLRRIELLGSGETEADEICSDYIGVVAQRGYEQRVANSLVELIDDGALGPWDELCFSAQNSEHTMPVLLSVTCKKLGRVRFGVSGGCPYIALPDSWDDYLANLSSSRRYLIRRSLRAFEKWAHSPPRLESVNDAADLARGIEILEQLHGKRWDQYTQASPVETTSAAGAFSSPQFRRFHQTVMPQLQQQNALQLLWLCDSKGPAAAIYNIVWNNKIHFYQSGRRMDLPQRVRVGVVIHALAIKQAIADKRREYDFLGGISSYKLQLTQEVRPLRTLQVTRPGARDKIQRAAASGLTMAKTARNALRKNERDSVDEGQTNDRRSLLRDALRQTLQIATLKGRSKPPG